MLRGDLDWIVMKALEKDRQRRYETANGLANDIRRYRAGEPVTAAPPSTAYRLRKLVQRNRGVFAAGCAVAVALLGGVVAFAWQARLAQHERDVAVDAQRSEAEQRQIADQQRQAAVDQRRVAEEPPMLLGLEKRNGSLLLTIDAEVGDPEDGAIQGFAIAGEDRRFHPADVAYAERGKDDRGQIQHDRKQLVLTSPMVPEPIHFRYAWGRNPLANLQTIGNKDIPFATQRSDEWKMEEVPLGVLGEEVTLPLSGADRNKIIQALREQDRERRLKEAEQMIKAS